MNYLSAVDSSFVDKPGGMARVAWDAAVAMRDRGHRVAVICARQRNGELISTVDGIQIVRYERPTLPSWHPARAERSIQAAADTAARQLGSQPWDIVHMHSPFTGLGVMRGLGEGPRYVYTAHSPLVMEQRINWASQGFTGRLKLLLGLGRLKRMERDLLRRSAAVHALSEYTKRQMGHFHGLADRVTVIPHWRRRDLKRVHSKTEARRMLGIPEDERYVFTVRGHGPRYGLDVAVRAIAPLARAGRCRFCLAGDGPLRPSLEALARELGVGDRIQFPGRLDDEALALWYEAADLFLLPTTALECFGLITLEAFAFGCPVLSTDACALPETMKPIMPDFLVPAGDEAALRAKLEAFVDGRLVPPPPERLLEYLEERYGESRVLPKLFALLEGDG